MEESNVLPFRCTTQNLPHIRRVTGADHDKQNVLVVRLEITVGFLIERFASTTIHIGPFENPNDRRKWKSRIKLARKIHRLGGYTADHKPLGVPRHIEPYIHINGMYSISLTTDEEDYILDEDRNRTILYSTKMSPEEFFNRLPWIGAYDVLYAAEIQLQEVGKYVLPE